MKKIYLGSNSPRRFQLLQQLGLSVEVLKGEIDETVGENETASDYVLRMAISKNQQIRYLFPNKRKYPLLTADTCIAFNNQILGKPHTEEEAFAMLSMLSGNTHHVLTAICVSTPIKQHYCLQSSEVIFKSLSTEEIHSYIASGEPFDKAGAYAIQGLAASFIRHLSGSYSGVMGLPLFETSELLKKFSTNIL
ncbi:MULTISPECIES: Maf family protein [Gallibacterium]|uniref:dTTP/UTP pyrophosphatase n=2 Tax=Gallibacterium TaxID=155493 RepID=A0A1A7PH66_9PAST|nr:MULTISPECIES: Maf family protein [Gallibacterium]KGQ37127.1 septum formation inhibitor Maf [Gallibacterium genomosp. 1]KGQ56854.1 septum formation inhibitor Maf [Gallibacterium anatis DSM 16844 = F 149]OBW94497.1 septum formation inhibitor Maf [Gallibacterium anatis]OBX00138.1 septum formation inhibitor Maf [Gallibacterium genomosp. 1]OBX01052.1 septum formation inhibitor Maf [Gallibacterium anatis]